ncbi:MAG: DUF934 domain-containing protein [Rhodospirillaceae bacterium]|nr:DUF934 domain-containing protein [Rhodospirillaceae bacterium]
MPLLKNGKEVEDPWHLAVDGDALPVNGPVIVFLARWKAEREALLRRNIGVGVRLKNTDKVAELADDLDRLGVVALEFPKFSDGRAYTQARLLRERYAYRGELRATGNVLPDQLLFMHRCGFDAFEATDPRVLRNWENVVGAFSLFYQPTGDGRATVNGLRQTRAASDNEGSR